MIRYEPVAVADPDLHQVLNLLRSVWRTTVSLVSHTLNGFIAITQQGPRYGCNAFNADGKLVGHYVVVPAPLREQSSGKTHLSALSLNTAVDESARGKGLFTELANRTYDMARQKGINYYSWCCQCSIYTWFY